MRSDFMLAINQLCAERKLSPDVVLEAVEASLISAYRRNFGSAMNVEVKIEPTTGDVRVFAAKEIVEDVLDPKEQISLEEAQRLNPEVQIGETLLIESTPKEFGRIAAQTAKQVILQRIREAERDALYSSFADSAGEIAHGTVQSIDYHSGDVIVNLEGAEAVLPSREQVPSERYRRGSRLRAYVLEVRRGNRGPQITLSRRSPALLRRLLELEVPEIFSGAVEIKGIAREAGSRSKVAVHATQDGVDPVGSCVGVRGGRIQNVVNELGGEKIDVVQWDADMAAFIANSLSPAKVMNVLLDDGSENGRTATVIVPNRQLSLAIGKEGQNARLAAKLTGWRIDIKSASEAAEETLGRLEDVRIAPEDMDLLRLAESMLRGQAEGGISEEQRAKVEVYVSTTEAADLPWPDEPALEAAADTAAPSGEVEGQGELATAEAGAAESASEVGSEGPDAKEVATLDVEPGAVRPEDEVLDALPPFEGEQVEGSLGWVITQPEEDYYSGWAEADEIEDLPPVLERDDLELEPEGGPARDKKKRKKKRSRRSRDFDDDYGADLWDA